MVFIAEAKLNIEKTSSMKEFYGYARTRDTKGNVVNRHLNKYVNSLHTSVGSARDNMEVLIAEFDMNKIKQVGQISSSQDSRIIDSNGISYAVIHGEKGGTPKVIEPQVLTPKRTYFGKKIRKKYESGEINISRHDMTKMEPRDDGVSNTLTSVQKDNYIAIPEDTKQCYADRYEGVEFKGKIIKEGSGLYTETSDMFTRGGLKNCSRTLKANVHDAGVCQNFRIRKLTPRECFRLMGVTEDNIDKIQQSGVSQSQQYKMAGNSIVVEVLEHIFRKLFIDTHQESQQLSLF